MTCTRLEILSVMKIQIMVFWVMTQCSEVVGYKNFGQPSYLHLCPEYALELRFGYGGIYTATTWFKVQSTMKQSIWSCVNRMLAFSWTPTLVSANPFFNCMI
jgi:hypothetical protein